MKPKWRAFFFFLPLAIFFGTPALILWLSGEFTSGDVIVTRQTRDPQTLFGLAYSDSSAYVKSRRLAQVHPQVLALGNSRVLQFRAEFFRPEVRFYNAGANVIQVQDFRTYLELLAPADLPKFLLLSMDSSFFQLSADRESAIKSRLSEQARHVKRHSAPAEIYKAQWLKVWSDLFAGKIKPGPVFGSRIGLLAMCNHAGYRADGSYLYSALDNDITNPHHRDYQFAQTLSRITHGEGRFAYGAEVSQKALVEVDRLLDFCREKHIHAIGFSPPFPHAVASAMGALGDKYAYITKTKAALQTRFAARGFEFYDFSDFATVQSPDDEAIDGFHGSERTYLRMVLHMVEHGSRLREVSDARTLRAVLQAAQANFNLPYEASVE